jgi:hypothetical protein
MRVLLSTLILVAAMLQVSPPDRGKQNAPPNKKQNTTKQPPTSAPIPTIDNQKCPCQERNSANAQPQKAEEKSIWGDVPSWMLVFVTGFAALIALWTLTDIKKQTKNTAAAVAATKIAIGIAQNSADAALLNAKAVINSERAWVFCHWKKFAQGYMLFMQNHGRTPAEIIDFVQREVQADNLPMGEDSLPSNPDYGAPTHLIQTRILPPGDTWEPPEWYILTHNLPAPGKLSFFFYGVVRYRDVLPSSEVHETRFCYFWSPSLGRLIIGGPSEYTKYT